MLVVLLCMAKANKRKKENVIYTSTASILLAWSILTWETQTVAAEIQSFENPLKSETLCAAAIVTYLALIYQRCPKAKSAKLGSPVSVIHCSAVFAKDHLKLMAIIFG